MELLQRAGAFFSVYAGFQFLLIDDLHCAAGERDDAFLLKVFQHPRDDFPRTTEIPRDLLVGRVQRVGVRADGFVQQITCQPFVKAGEKDLIHRPHYIGKMFGCFLIDVILHIHILLHQGAETGNVCDDQFCILVRFNLDVKRDFLNDTGSGECTDLAISDAEKSDLSGIP